MAATLNFRFRLGVPEAVVELADETIVGRGPLPELASLAGTSGWDYCTVSKEGILYLSLSDVRVSRRHFAIRRETGPTGDRYLIRDLGSTCGFSINGDRCGSPTEIELNDRDIIHFGVQFHFCLR